MINSLIIATWSSCTAIACLLSASLMGPVNEVSDLQGRTLQLMLGIVTAIVGASTAYLRLFVAKETGRLEKSILDTIERRFQTREITEVKFGAIGRRIKAVETILQKRGASRKPAAKVRKS